jgi:pantetheine-phosphate adenylyltransferase
MLNQLNAMAIIRGLRVFSDFEFEFRYAIANKKLAPQIETVAVMTDERHLHISSSTVREVAELDGDVSLFVPDFVAVALQERFAELRQNGDNPGYTVSIRD